MRKKIVDITTVKFLLVGVLNTLIGSAVMFLLYNFAGVNYWLSSAANYLVGGTVSFFLNKYFTFQNTEKSGRQVLKFIATVAACYLLAYGLAKPAVSFLLSGCSQTLRENVAMVTGMVLYTGLNYLGQRFFAFQT